MESFTEAEIAAILAEANRGSATPSKATRGTIYEMAKDLNIPKERIDDIIAKRHANDPLALVERMPNPTNTLIHNQLIEAIRIAIDDLRDDDRITIKHRNSTFKPTANQGWYTYRVLLPARETKINVGNIAFFVQDTLADIVVRTLATESAEHLGRSRDEIRWNRVAASSIPDALKAYTVPPQRHVTMTFHTPDALRVYGTAITPVLERWKEYIATVKTT